MNDGYLSVRTDAPSELFSLFAGNTPVVSMRVATGKRTVTLRLKLESFNPCGSIKDRTALTLFDSVAGRIDSEAGLIESTSGNLGVALSAIAHSHGVPFTAVVDPRTPFAAVHAMRRLGARVVVASEHDGHGGYLLTRLRIVRDALAGQPDLCWTNQYDNPANPRAHERGTAPELAAQIGRAGVVLMPVSTGGTLAGVRAYAVRETDWTVVGVDVRGSRALSDSTGVRVLSGIGSSRRSTFTTEADGPMVLVGADEAVSACVWLYEQSGIGVGASSGALVAAALNIASRHGLGEVTCICPDGAGNYLNTVYSPAWRAENGISVDPGQAIVESVDWG
ncbi:MAG: pyridoxal-phosphate dependent enzyme [Kibdelosporangium sp.]